MTAAFPPSNNKNNKNKSTTTSSSGTQVRVVARIRPLSAQEKAANNNDDNDDGGVLRKLQGKTALVQVAATKEKKWYELDAVLEGHATQADVYAQSGAQQAVCHDLLQGYNASILAYGQTGAGKVRTPYTTALLLEEK